MDVRALTGPALQQALEQVAELRIQVFRAWPYIYDGDIEYEQKYLQTYSDSKNAILIGAYEGDRLVGASTGTPLADHADDFGQAFEGAGLNLDQVFYCAESVLLPNYRGRGIGHRFFDLRETHARQLGFAFSAFCAVIRSTDHPLRPIRYRPLDGFWRARGYAPVDGVTAAFSWKDIDQADETVKNLQFWMRQL